MMGVKAVYVKYSFNNLYTILYKISSVMFSSTIIIVKNMHISLQICFFLLIQYSMCSILSYDHVEMQKLM